jgi:hypothetical protein
MVAWAIRHGLGTQGCVISGGVGTSPTRLIEGHPRLHWRCERRNLVVVVYRFAFHAISIALFLFGKAAIIAQDDPFLIKESGVGRIHLGMTVDEFLATYEGSQVRLVDLHVEGMFSPALKVQSNGHPLLTAEIDRGWVIFRIQLEDRRFHTAEGISIGSTFAEIRTTYPGLKVGMGEGQWFGRIDKRALSFGLDAADIHKPPTNESKVTSILIVR